MDEAIDVSAIQRRDRQAWALLYDSLVHATYGLIWKLTGGNRQVCEDLNQATWLAAMDSIDDFDPVRGNIKGWVLGIARNKALQRLRKSYQSRVESGGTFRESETIQSTLAATPAAIIEANERAAVIQAALATLPPDRRAVLHSKYIEGLSVKQIANKTGKTPKAVESMLSRSREQLRDLLHSHFIESESGT